MKSDVQISREAKFLNIAEVAKKLSIKPQSLLHYGHHKAKIDYSFLEKLFEPKEKEQSSKQSKKQSKKLLKGKLILVTAMSPTPAGEGKTTTTVGLGDALNLIGKKATVCLREPSLGPCFGVKGGGTGGGYAQVVPMDEINLHFTGDFHAITSAHNLLSALIDNHIQWGNQLNLDPRKILWKRVIDMNDRSLRQVVTGIGGLANGTPRESGFDITVASEIMAIFCLSSNLGELRERVNKITIGYTYDSKPVYAKDIKATGAILTLLKDAFMPNLVQTLEGNPALVHGGPFANIAHGCSSVIATKTAMALSDYVVTEAGFGADLGAEKFINIKCRKSNLAPDAVVVVATIRALKMHGGVNLTDLKTENPQAVKIGCDNLGRHIQNLQKFAVPVVVAINGFVSDTSSEMNEVKAYCKQLGVEVIACSHWANGGAGAKDLAEYVVEMINSNQKQFQLLYPDEMPLLKKIQLIAQKFYGAADIAAETGVMQKFKSLEKQGFGHLPICVAKTQYSFASDAKLMGAPKNHTIFIRDVILASGAEFVVVVCGTVMTMPGLPKIPSANQIDLDEKRNIVGLF